MSCVLKCTHNKLSQVFNFLYTRCVECHLTLSMFFSKTTNSKYLGLGYIEISLRLTSQRDRQNTGYIFLIKYSKTCLKRNAIVPVFFFSVFTGFRFTKGCVLIKRSTKNMIAWVYNEGII